MKWTRIGAAAVIVVALALSATQSHSRAQTFPAAIPCNAGAISAAYTQVDSVQSFGCEGGYAYLWATVGHGEGEIGVTEVVSFDESTMSWKNASRLRYCFKHRLPTYVEYWGCNSN
jgi:hypothetical protein